MSSTDKVKVDKIDGIESNVASAQQEINKINEVIAGGVGSDDVQISAEEPTNEDIKLWVDTDDEGQPGSGGTSEIAGDTLPIGAVVEYSGDTVPENWELYEEQMSNNYSTEETNTGKKWIDGKPIYRKVIVYTTQPSTSEVKIPNGVSNLEEYIDVKALLKRKDGVTNIFNRYAEDTWKCVIEDVEKTRLIVGVGTMVRNNTYWGNITVTIEYTKTTD